MASAHSVWAGTGLWSFELAPSQAEADCTITWSAPDLPSAWTDGAGGSLAVTSGNVIRLDGAERWLLQGAEAVEGQFRLLPVLIHEIGHLLGMEHTMNAEDVMFPYYMEGKLALSAADLQQARELYPAEGASAET